MWPTCCGGYRSLTHIHSQLKNVKIMVICTKNLTPEQEISHQSKQNERSNDGFTPSITGVVFCRHRRQVSPHPAMPMTDCSPWFIAAGIPLSGLGQRVAACWARNWPHSGPQAAVGASGHSSVMAYSFGVKHTGPNKGVGWHQTQI